MILKAWNHYYKNAENFSELVAKTNYNYLTCFCNGQTKCTITRIILLYLRTKHVLSNLLRVNKILEYLNN